MQSTEELAVLTMKSNHEAKPGDLCSIEQTYNMQDAQLIHKDCVDCQECKDNMVAEV